nr:immunoglobulin heavy chain junction region [Mus musculus]MBK4195039.1 immunoglobulin heavy chain junction region [Mus musculus]
CARVCYYYGSSYDYW